MRRRPTSLPLSRCSTKIRTAPQTIRLPSSLSPTRLLLNITAQIMKLMIAVLQRNLARIDRLGDDPRAVLIRHQYVFALIWSARYREADAMQQETSALARTVSPIADRKRIRWPARYTYQQSLRRSR